MIKLSKSIVELSKMGQNITLYALYIYVKNLTMKNLKFIIKNHMNKEGFDTKTINEKHKFDTKNYKTI